VPPQHVGRRFRPPADNHTPQAPSSLPSFTGVTELKMTLHNHPDPDRKPMMQVQRVHHRVQNCMQHGETDQMLQTMIVDRPKP
jgi:hypothetical protein